MAFSPRQFGARFARALCASLSALVFAAVAHATIGAALQMQLGNPSSASADPSNHAHYLIQRDQYALDYNDATHEPNWVSWDLTAADVGSSGRSSFIQDTTLPLGFYQVLTTDYSGSGYDRGHMCPSADRTITTYDNQQVFYMSNMVPQAPDNNQGVWANFESYCRSLASAGNEVLITCGPSGFGGSTIASGVAIPGYTWKFVVVVPLGAGTALDRINSSTRVIAIKVPNIAGVRNTPWQDFITSVAQIEADTGYTFFTALPSSVASALRLQVDGQTAVGAPSIVAQPVTQTTVVGGTATFAVTATGDAPLAYQWLKDDVEIAGATNATLTLSGVGAADVGNYDVVVTNAVGSVTSNSASLVVTGLPPVVTTPPQSVTLNAGGTAIFSVTASGSPTLSYQWRKDLTPIAYATNATLTLANVQASDIGSYDVVVTNSVGTATSAPATLTVNPAAPTVTTQPAAQNPTLGGSASFTVGVSGSAPLSYQWFKGTTALTNGGVVSGATTATLLLSGVSAVDAGNYSVVVTNTLGSATSTAAALTVSAPPPAAILWNFSDGTANPASNSTTDVTASALSQGNNNGTTALVATGSASSGYAGASGGFNAGAAARIGALNQGAGGSAYFEFTLTPTAGKRLVLNGIQFGSRSTGTGPQAYAIYTSVDNYTTPLASATVLANSSWGLKLPSFTTLTGATSTPVAVRIYGYNGAGGAVAGTANWRIDDLNVTASTVFPPPVAPVVASTSPANGATNVDVANPITVTFNEAVSFTGSWFSITSAANGSTAAAVSGGPTTFKIQPPSNFAYNDTVTVTINGANVVDQASGTIHGTTNTTFSFTTGAYVPPTPPSVTTQPTPQSTIVGGSASFSVAASGTNPLSYLWRHNGSPLVGNASATTATLTLTNATTADAGSYDCVVSNVAGSDISQPAALTVTVVPVSITTQPTAQVVGYGGSASFSVAAAGTAPFAYQWRKGGVPLSDGATVTGAGTATLTVSNATLADIGSYDVVVTNAVSSSTTRAVVLAITDSPSVVSWDFTSAAPTTGIPANVSGGVVSQGNNNGTTTLLTTTSASGSYPGSSGGNNVGAAARTGGYNPAAGGSAYFEFTFAPSTGRQFAATGISFGMRSTGTGPKSYAVLSSADGFTVPLATGVVPADSAWHLYTPSFGGVIGAADGTVTFRIYGFDGTGSPGANTANWRIDDLKLTAGIIVAPVTITSSPATQTVTVGDTATFAVTASGSAPLTYQWRKGGAPIDGATDATLALPGVLTAATGTYDVVVSNVVGSATSAPATLTVNKAVATVALADLTATYSGNGYAATVTTSPAGLATVVTYNGSPTLPVNAGTYAVSATVQDANYVGSATGTLVIQPAVAGVQLGGLTLTYDGAPHGASATTSPAGLTVALTYNGSATLPVNAGSYTVAATVQDPNYVGSATGTLVIQPALADVQLGGLAVTYDGAAHAASVTTSPVGVAVAVTYNGGATLPVNAGAYAVAATVTDPNYTGSASGLLVIAKATATVTLSGLTQSYDGTPKAVSVVTSPANLPVTVTYDGSATAPTFPGAYAVTATVTDPNYTGTAADTLRIMTTALVRHTPTLDGGLDGSIQVLSPESLTLNGNAWISGDLLVPGTPDVRASGKATYAGMISGTGAATPSNYTVTLAGNAVVRYVVRSSASVALPVVTAPTAPSGTLNVTVSANQPAPASFADVRNVTLNGRAGSVAVPAGAYGALTANGGTSLVLGTVGATEPAVYNLQSLTLNGGGSLTVVGPVVINVASSVAFGGKVGAAAHPAWLVLTTANGNVTVNGGGTFAGSIVAPNGTVTLSGGSTVTGHVAADRLVLNGQSMLTER